MVVLWSEELKEEEEKSEQGSGRHYIRRMWPRVDSQREGSRAKSKESLNIKDF